MSSTIIVTIVSLSLLAAVSAVILYFVAQKFQVEEDPRIDEIQGMLPSANCGGCGFAGCRNFAESLVVSETFDGLNCPVGGNKLMKSLAKMLGKTAIETDPAVTILLCNGTTQFRPKTIRYDGVENCSIQHYLYIGETDCAYGCLRNGDCVEVCM